MKTFVLDMLTAFVWCLTILMIALVLFVAFRQGTPTHVLVACAISALLFTVCTRTGEYLQKVAYTANSK